MASVVNPGAADPASRQRRIVSAGVVGLVHALLGYAFLAGLGVPVPLRAPDGLKLFDVLPDPPPPPPVPPPAPHAAARKQGASSPRNLKSKATPVVVPPVPAFVPPPIVAAPVAGLGGNPSAGASNVRGPGTGAGGQGSGTGSGLAGDGDGDGGTPVRWRSGRIKDSDYPRWAFEANVHGTVQLRFTVGVDGRVTRCTVTRSIGNARMDDLTCQLIQQRLRYRPARDPSGEPVPSEIVGEQEWTPYPSGDDTAE